MGEEEDKGPRPVQKGSSTGYTMGEEEDKGPRPVQKGSSTGKAPLVEPRDDVTDDAGSTESGDRDNTSYHRVIERHGMTVKGGYFVIEHEPSSSSSKAMHQGEDMGVRPVQKGSSSGKAQPRDSVHGAAASQQDNVIDDAGSSNLQMFRSGDRDNTSYHRVIERHGMTVKGGYFVSEHQPSSSSSKAMHQQTCSNEVPDVVREIASRLPCDIAISQMARTGSAWAAALREVGFQVQGTHARLPWLQVPHPTGPVFFCISCGGGGAIVQHNIGIAEDRRRARYIGAFEGLWVVAAGTRIGGNMIFNLRSGASFRVPNEAVHGGLVQPLLLLATALSCAPDKPDCIGMGIVKYMANLLQSIRVVFFSPGRETAIDSFPGEFFDEPEDLTYHESSFWLLTTNEMVHRWDMALQPDGDITLGRWNGYFFPEYLDHDDYVVGRYLVPSRGEVLMVVRLSAVPYGAGGETTRFRVYKMTLVELGKSEDEPARWRWTELGSLAGRMLFIGRGCSRSYEASDYPSLTEGLYFSDGRTTFYAEDILNNFEAPCSDNGRWSVEANVERCFPQDHKFSSYSSSGWVLQ